MGSVMRLLLVLAALVVSGLAAAADPAPRREVYILAGQSNMSGRGNLAEVPVYANASRIWVYTNAGRWEPGQDPLDSAEGQTDPVSADPVYGAGSGMPFANRLAELRPGVEIGLVPCAKGGSLIADWNRDWRRIRLYGSCLARAREASHWGEIKGILWYQGEADARALDTVAAWPAKFAELVATFRADLGQPFLPFVFTRLSRDPQSPTWPYWARMQLAQQQFADAHVPGLIMVDASDLPLGAGEQVHLSTAGYVTLGGRYADAMQSLLTP